MVRPARSLVWRRPWRKWRLSGKICTLNSFPTETRWVIFSIDIVHIFIIILLLHLITIVNILLIIEIIIVTSIILIILLFLYFLLTSYFWRHFLTVNVWKSFMWTADKEVNFAVMNTTWAVVKIRPEKISGLYGIVEVMGSNPVQAWIFFRPYFHCCLRIVHYYEDRFHIHDVFC